MATKRVLALLGSMVMGVVLAVPGAAGAADGQVAPKRGLYTVPGAAVQDREALLNAGIDVLGGTGSTLSIVATPEQAADLHARGMRLDVRGDFTKLLAERNAGDGGPRVAGDFPPGDEAYHTYPEITKVLTRTATKHSTIARLTSVGKSFQGRPLHLFKISDNVKKDEDEPEVLFTCNQHAREHLTAEMCLRIVDRFTARYGTDRNVTNLVNNREIWLVPNVNPDGSEYDIRGGEYKGWRKTRQPWPGGVGTDTNRNWGYKWACCNGASPDPASFGYHGPKPFSEPETKAVAKFVNSRVVAGKQQLKAAIDFHTFGQQVLWPFGYTTSPTTPDMAAADARRLRQVGKRMAATNGYTAQQSSAFSITSGDIDGWLWGRHRILTFAVEMYPGTADGLDGFYPPASVIPRETSRNDKAVDVVLREAGRG